MCDETMHPMHTPHCLQYTIILSASKNLPNQCVDFMKGKTIHRKSVGVRMPGDPVCQVSADTASARMLPERALPYEQHAPTIHACRCARRHLQAH